MPSPHDETRLAEDRKDFEELGLKLNPAQIELLSQRLAVTFRKAMDEYIKPEVAERLALSLQELRDKAGCTLQVTDLAADLAKRWSEDSETVLLKGLVLYQIAREAKEKGNSLVIINPEDTVVENITDVEAPVPVKS